jgi:hypothetical protein
MPLRVGEVLSATVRRKLSTDRVLISFKGHTLVAEPEHDVSPGEEISVQVLTIFPRIRLRLLSSAQASAAANYRRPLDIHT